MSASTIGKLNGRVSIEQVLQFIRDNFDANAKITYHHIADNDEIPTIQERYDDSGRWRSESCNIAFDTAANGARSVFYAYDNINCYEGLEYYKGLSLERMVTSETTYLSIGYWGQSVDIMKEIVTHFGGWIDENDCDDVEFYEIIKV